jgi:hypothetical protein
MIWSANDLDIIAGLIHAFVTRELGYVVARERHRLGSRVL